MVGARFTVCLVLMAATAVAVAVPDADARVKKCKRGQLVVKVQGKRTCRAVKKAFPKPRVGDPRLTFLRTALGARLRGVKRPPKAARKMIAKLRSIAPQVLAKVDGLRSAGARSAAVMRANCEGAPDVSSSTTVGGASVTAVSYTHLTLPTNREV